MVIIYAISLSLLLAYFIVIVRYSIAWIQIKEIEDSGSGDSRVTIIIPCRNESRNLNACLQAIADLDYPREQFELIIVDDQSEDSTAKIASSFFDSHADINGQLITLGNASVSGKKEAITKGISASRHPLIVTTDADCIVPKKWLSSMTSYYEQTGAKMIAAPVTLRHSGSLIERIQELEMLGLQAVAGGSIKLNEPVLCNGANLLYEKEAFLAVGGYTDNSNIASGDDLFLLQKIQKKYPGKVSFLKSIQAWVQTRPVISGSDLLRQRKRWVSKVIHIPDVTTILVAFIVYLINLTVLINIALWAILPEYNLSVLVVTIGGKVLIDFVFLQLASSSFSRTSLMKNFILTELIYIVYVSFIGIFGNLGNYEWKGRSSKQRSFVSNRS